MGHSGKLLDPLLEEIGLQRGDVFICNTLKRRPPGNRDPHPEEIENCHEYLLRQVELIEPRVICTLGNFATKLLRADPTGITRLHGREEVRVIGSRAVRLYPIFHPAAALYTPANVEVLRTDFARIPELLAMAPPPQPGRRGGAPRPARAARAAGGARARARGGRRRRPADLALPIPYSVGGDRLRALGRRLRACAARVPGRGDRVAGSTSSTYTPAERWSTSRPEAKSSPARWRPSAAR